LADVEQLPAELRVIARRIDGAAVALMSQIELRLRCEYVLELQSRADNEPPDKAGRTRKLAERVIHSLSDYSFSKKQAELSDALADASRRQDMGGAHAAMAELRALEARNPRIPRERVMGHATGVIVQAVEAKLTIPPPPKSRIFNRKRKG
jgi:hypothetical protein